MGVVVVVCVCFCLLGGFVLVCFVLRHSHYFGRDPLIRCISPMSSVSRLSHPFHLPVPRILEFVAAAVLFEFVLACLIA